MRIPPSEDEARLEIFTNNLLELGRRAEHHGVKLALETGADAGAKLKTFLDALGSPGLAASIDPGSILQAGIDPIATVRELASWVVHAYAKDATGSAGVPAINPRGFGFPPGALDWEEYLGSLEEIGYRGFLTVWPARAARCRSVYRRRRPAQENVVTIADKLAVGGVRALRWLHDSAPGNRAPHPTRSSRSNPVRQRPCAGRASRNARSSSRRASSA